MTDQLRGALEIPDRDHLLEEARSSFGLEAVIEGDRPKLIQHLGDHKETLPRNYDSAEWAEWDAVFVTILLNHHEHPAYRILDEDKEATALADLVTLNMERAVKHEP